ncbi:MAG: hypothetical protein K2Y37_10950 [Pirellulales bacterium]|nr:hypothetical protein [Pirellulales bacterium]
MALELVKGIVTFEPFILSWHHGKKCLWGDFHSIQDAAGSKLVCPNADRRECTDTCHIDGFHAMRRGYATLHAERLSAPGTSAQDAALVVYDRATAHRDSRRDEGRDGQGLRARVPDHGYRPTAIECLMAVEDRQLS